LYNYLKENDIHAQVHYEPVHLQPYYKKSGNKLGDMPVAEDFYRHCLSLPIYPTLAEEEQEYVIEKVKEFVSQQEKSRIKISIIVPVYNVEKYLRQCLDSLVNQTLKDIEIICVNDASPDNSLSILQEYAQIDNRITVINLKENRKQGGARNAGIQIAQGEYIGIVDSDDWVATDMYESLWNASMNSTVDMVCSDYYTYYEQSKKVVFTENIPDSIIKDDIENIHKYVLINGGRGVTNIIKKHLFIDYQLFYPENLIYEDNAIGGSLYCMSKAVNKASKPLYYYRVRETSTTGAKDNFRLFDRLQTSVMMLEHTKRLGIYNRYQVEVDYSFYCLYYRNTLSCCFFEFSIIPKEYINIVKENFPKYISISGNKYYKNKKNYREHFFKLLQWNTNIGIWTFNCFIGVARIMRKVKNHYKSSN
jgi:glycosyltransferase involved in cell wall biosynthesis